jgi:protein O-mannosyl-transferase
VITLAAFWGMWHNQFVNYDDNEYILGNPNVVTGLSGANLAWAFNAGYCGNWHPLTWMSHMLDCQLFGVNPAGHHAMNLILHIANTILLFLVLFRMTRARWRSAFVAALFTVHPLHVQSVAWAAERKDVLSTFFWMLTIGAYVLYTEKPNWKRYSLTAAAFVLGIMAKPMVVTLPLVLLMLDYWPLRRSGQSSVISDQSGDRARGAAVKRVLEKAPLFALSAGCAVITYIAQKRGEAVSTLELVPLGMRIENALVSYVSYILKMLWPSNLAVLYPHPMRLLPVWQVLGAVVVLAGITAFVFRTRNSRPYLFTGWLWFVVTLIPVIGIVQVGSQAIADRYTYVPLVGLFMMVAWGVPELIRKGETERSTPNTHTLAPPDSHTILLAATSLIIVVVLRVCTHMQVGYWKDNLTLFRHAIECTRDNYVMHNSYGLALADAGRADEAKAQYEESLRIRPAYVSARIDLGIALSDEGKLNEAVAQFKQAIEIDPNYADSYFSLGLALEMMKDIPGAARQYEKAIKLKPDHTKAHINLGRILLASGHIDEAMSHFQDALRADPLAVEARSNLAAALYDKHDFAGSTREYREVIRVKPDHGPAHSNLAILLFVQGDYAGSWSEVRLAETYGSPVEPRFLAALARKMPDPGM